MLNFLLILENKHQLCIVSPKPAKQAVAPEEGPRKESLALIYEVSPLVIPAPQKDENKGKLQEHKVVLDTSFSSLPAFSASDSCASVLIDAQK